MKPIDLKKLAKKFKLEKLRLPTSWSVSRYKDSQECAARYAYKYILKLKEKPNPAMERGTKIHLLMEHFLLGKVKGIPDELKLFAKELRNLKKLGAKPEEQWVIAEDGTRTKWDDWARAWLRAKIDAHFYFKKPGVLLVVDLKTGRKKEAIAQAEVYAWLGLIVFPDVKEIEVELWFSDKGETTVYRFTASDAKIAGQKWTKRARKLLAMRKFVPEPGDSCRWCPFRDNKELLDGTKGPCREWRKAA